MLFFKTREPQRLEGDKIALRPFQKQDIKIIQSWLYDGELTELAFGIPSFHPNFDNLMPTYKKEIEANRHSFFAIETKASEFIGFCCYSFTRTAPEKRARIGILIGYREYWGKGYGRDAVKRLLQHLFHEKNMDVIELDTAPHNVRAQGCFESCGFRFSHTEWKDHRERYWYELSRHQFLLTAGPD